MSKKSKDRIIYLLIFSIFIFVVTTFITAIISPPNNWDSMTYHMARVAHWSQNHNVNHYPTLYIPQLMMPPFAEFGILHFFILAQGDLLANLVQWLCMIGCLIGVSIIAQTLGASVKGQIISAIFCVTIPMGILQSSSTQNDYVVSLWLVIFAYFIFSMIREKKYFYFFYVVGAAISLGLAMLTKITAYFYALPFLAIFAFFCIREKIWKCAKVIFIIGIIALLVNSVHYTRNMVLFGNPLGSTDGFIESEHRITEFTLPTFVSNVLRNMALHSDFIRNLGIQQLITPTTGLTEKALVIFHGFINVDISDSRITMEGKEFHVPGLSYDENTAGNPLHFLLILFSALLVLLRLRKIGKHNLIMTYFLAVFFGFLLFCLMLKWQPYTSRYHLPFFILFSPLVGIVLSRLNKFFGIVLVFILILSSAPFLVNNKFRPLVGDNNIFSKDRTSLYFSNRFWLENSYISGIEFIKSEGCDMLGLNLNNDYWEYPLWALLKNRSIRIEHINVTNAASKVNEKPRFNNFIPCAIFSLEFKESTGSTFFYRNRTYSESFFADPVKIFTIT
jgi:hypothetical protein